MYFVRTPFESYYDYVVWNSLMNVSRISTPFLLATIDRKFHLLLCTCALCSLFRSMKNTVYTYPDVWVCLYDGYGCDTYEKEEKCLNSYTITAGGKASAVFYPDGEYEQEVPVLGDLTDSVSMLVLQTHSCRNTSGKR